MGNIWQTCGTSGICFQLLEFHKFGAGIMQLAQNIGVSEDTAEEMSLLKTYDLPMDLLPDHPTHKATLS